MQRQNVKSSNINSIGYDRATQVLEVEFNSGAIYQYHGVPEDVFTGLMGASSHGQYFDINIKKAGYTFTRVK